MSNFKDLTGQTFGEWTVIERAEDHVQPRGYHITMWHCKCSCGTERDVYANSLLTGCSKSCGCKGKEARQQVAKNNFTTHGDSKTRLYKIWFGMKKRCDNPNDYNYSNYGGRGISVCPEWYDYLTFKDWAIRNGYQDDLSIDRIDVGGNYTPDNCRWVGSVAQANNRRTSKYYECNGESHTLTEWSTIIGKPYKSLWKHIHNGGRLDQLL